MTYELLTTDMGQKMLDPKLIEKIMPNKSGSATTPPLEESKDTSVKYNFGKFEYDLYHEEDDISEKVIRVKRVFMPNNGEKWKVMNDTKIIFTIESTKISKKEREFLQTIDGFNFILSQAKTGIKSLNGFRAELKKVLNKKTDKKVTTKKKKKIRSAKKQK